MFTSLHALAKQATLMITVAAEGDDQLRVTVTPAPLDGKAKAGLPQPLSLVATPDEFDADFGAALATWRAPKRSLVQQAQDATGAALPALASAEAPKLAAPKEKGKPGRKTRGDKPATEADAAGGSAADDSNGDVDQGEQPAAPGSDEQAGAAPAVEGGDSDSATGAPTDTAAAPVLDDQAGAGATQQPAPAPAAAAPAAAATAGAAVDTFTIDLF